MTSQFHGGMHGSIGIAIDRLGCVPDEVHGILGDAYVLGDLGRPHFEFVSMISHVSRKKHVVMTSSLFDGPICSP